jgi:hypothetical protein
LVAFGGGSVPMRSARVDAQIYEGFPVKCVKYLVRTALLSSPDFDNQPPGHDTHKVFATTPGLANRLSQIEDKLEGGLVVPINSPSAIDLPSGAVSEASRSKPPVHCNQHT